MIKKQQAIEQKTIKPIVKVDLHNHLKTGGFGDYSAENVIKTAYIRLGKRGIVGVINYSPSNRFLEFYDKIPNKYDREMTGNLFIIKRPHLAFINGDEIETKQGHILALGIEKEVHPKFGRPFEDTSKEIHDLGGLVGVDHPFHLVGLGPYLQKHPDLYQQVDFYETYNGNAVGTNKKAKKEFPNARAHNPQIARSVTSDGHSVWEIGKNWMVIPNPTITSQDFDKTAGLTGPLQRAMIKATQAMDEEVNTYLVNESSLYVGAAEHITKIVISKFAKMFGCNTGKP